MNTQNERTLRDGFAEAALIGMLAGNGLPGSLDLVGRAAYGYADAMIAERERRAKVAAEDSEEASRKAREWVESKGLKVGQNAWGGVCVMDSRGVWGCGKDLAEAVADAKTMLAADPAPLAPEAQPAPTTPTREDDEAWAGSRTKAVRNAAVTEQHERELSKWRAGSR